MILTKHFVFLHYPKTGGSFVRKIFKNSAPRSWELTSPGKHLDFVHCPESHKSLPVIGFVRNPFDWYVSWYIFSKNIYPHDFFNNVSDDGKLDFKKTILNVLEVDYNKYFNLDFGKIYGRPVGCYTAYVHSMFGEDLSDIRFGKFENLREDFLSLISEIVEPPLFMRLLTKHYPRVNTGKRTHYSDYYDEELIEAVSKKEDEMLKRFDYKFEFVK